MKWLNFAKIRLVLVVFVVTIVLGYSSAQADFTWGTPTNLGPEVNSSYDDACVSISANGLEFYFASDRPGGYGGIDLWVMKRPTIEDDWGTPENLGSPVNSQYSYWEPSISSDGLSLYFSDGHTPQFGNRLPGGLGGQGDIWMITRKTIHDAWGAPVNIGPAVNSQHAVSPSISADGLSLYFQSHRPGRIGNHCDIMVATRESTSDSFEHPVFLRGVNSPNGEWMPDISADGRALFFCRTGITELWVAMRATMDDDFGPPLKLPPQINISPYLNMSPTLSTDGRTLFFASNRPDGMGKADLWQVSIEPVVDLNGDGIVDAIDMCIMVDYWGTDEPLCDIGPMPWGDGIVDVQDLVVLAEHLFEDFDDPTLVAHWALDETEGITTHDSVNGYDDHVMGGALWQPDSGVIDGALEFDGVDDCIITSTGLNSSEGSFSVVAWIKGSVPGQVIISQPIGADWLMADTEGKLMTELKGFGGDSAAMLSETNIIDEQWHRIGLVWDGSQRMLCVDGITVAKDTQDGLEVSTGGLYIGVGKNYTPGTFFSGLIDDVRIYSRAVSP